MTDEQLRERAREWCNKTYPDGDFAQYGDPIQELADCLAAFAQSIQAEARQEIATMKRELDDKCTGATPYWTEGRHDWHLWPDNTHHCHTCGAIRENPWGIRVTAAEDRVKELEQQLVKFYSGEIDHDLANMVGELRKQLAEARAQVEMVKEAWSTKAVNYEREVVELQFGPAEQIAAAIERAAEEK